MTCQVVGCDERAEPYGYALDVGNEVEVRVVLCRRHEAQLLGRPLTDYDPDALDRWSAEKVAEYRVRRVAS